MQFNEETNNLDLVSEIDALCDSDSDSYPIKDKTRRVNYSLEELVAMIINADGTWQYDDTNYTDLPVGTGTLVEAQQSYSFASEYLSIEIVKVKDSEGNWRALKPIDDRNFRTITLEDYFTDTGMPTHYDKEGDTIKLYPAPTADDVTLLGGLKVHFKRTAELFVYTDTDREPGLPSPFHIILAYMASIPYCMTYKQDRVALYVKKVDEMKKDIVKFYSHREGDKKKKFKFRGVAFR